MKRGQLLLMALAILVLGAFTYGELTKDISKTDVKGAANIMGLEFSEPEIDSLMPALTEFRDAYIKNRDRQLDNGVYPAVMFNPVPPGMVIPQTGGRVQLRGVGKLTLPEQKEKLAYMSIRELAELIRTKQISSVDLTKFFIDRLKKYDSKLKCVINFTEELAMEQAKKADEALAKGDYKGVLHGIPYGIKDLFATKVSKTTWGAKPYKDQSFDYNATVVEKLEAAGAVLIAKMSVGALAMGDVWYGGMTRNPWDMETGSSGSSAGSAAAVSAGLLPYAIGTETLGSIVSPSTVCGTTGLRPTFGRVSRYGAMALTWSMDKVGPIARSAEDCAIVFDAIYGPDGKDPSVIPAAFNYTSGFQPKSIKVGYLKSAFEQDYPFKVQDSIALNVFKKMGVELIPIELPEFPDIMHILTVEAAAAFDDLTRSGKDDELTRQLRNAWPNLFRQARFVPAVEYVQANRLRTKLMEQMEEVFKKVDVYIHPSWASSSLRITNFTGHPCVVVPDGFQDNGRPTSITITGKLFDEGTVLGLANTFQNYSNFNRLYPELDKE
jgi:Asp-tRNA(Asn)/Glu-tRNA(Gln) amidotransferase A subunit family amidase